MPPKKDKPKASKSSKTPQASKPAKVKKVVVSPKAKVKAPKLLNVPFWIGFDLGGTKMMASVLDKNYVVLGSARKSTN